MCSSASRSTHRGYKTQITALIAHASGSSVFVDHDFASSSCQHSTRAASSSFSVASPAQYRCATTSADVPESDRRSLISIQLSTMKRTQRSACLFSPTSSSILFSRSIVRFNRLPSMSEIYTKLSEDGRTAPTGIYPACVRWMPRSSYSHGCAYAAARVDSRRQRLGDTADLGTCSVKRRPFSRWHAVKCLCHARINSS